MRRHLLFWAAGLGVLAAAGAEDRPNVVVILTDDQGWGDLSLHGNGNLETPHLDGLARAGAQFETFYVSPVCSPTRAEFLTGRYHPRGGIFATSAGGEWLDLDEHCIAESFRAAGYATGAFGKWHNGTQAPYHPNSRGFDEFYGFCSGHWGHYFSPMLERNGETVTGDGYLTDDFTNRAMEFIEAAHAREQPFLVFLPFCTPHSPMQVPDRWWEKFADRDLEFRSREGDREDIGHTRAALAMCENIDWNVGRLVDKLEALGIGDDTIVVFFGDNGPNGWRWNGGMRGRKGSTDEGGVRSPLFIKWPGRIEAGMRIAEVAGAIDLFPTLAELAGIEPRGEKPFDGVSFAALLTGSGSAAPEFAERILFSHWNNKVSARTKRFRLDERGRLYDMAADPGQSHDIAEEQPETAMQLAGAVADWKRDVLAELDRKADRPFTVGAPGARLTHLPARDAEASGMIRRSNRFPNCSFFTNWVDAQDTISWDVDVLAAGRFRALAYITCAAENTGCVLELRSDAAPGAAARAEVTDAHDPPLIGRAEDRVPRQESYVKDFRPLELGSIQLKKGRQRITLAAPEIPGAAAVDIRLLTLER